MSITYFIGLGFWNGLGTIIYAARIPERWYPRKFDIYGASHQVLHVFVMVGALCHVVGVLKAFDYWQGRKSMGLAYCELL